VASRSGRYLGHSHLIPKLHRSRAVEHKPQPWHTSLEAEFATIVSNISKYFKSV
jgi:hypothetical protein